MIAVRVDQLAGVCPSPACRAELLAAGQVTDGILSVDLSSYASVVRAHTLPSPLTQGLNVVKALATWAKAGFPVVSDAVLFDRSAHCSLCEFWDAAQGRCVKCGCFGLKHWLATERCPMGKW